MKGCLGLLTGIIQGNLRRIDEQYYPSAPPSFFSPLFLFLLVTLLPAEPLLIPKAD